MQSTKAVPYWVVPIAIVVDKWCKAPTIRARFQRMLMEWGATEAKKAMRPGRMTDYDLLEIEDYPDPQAGNLPHRALDRCEKYAYLAAIHAAACELPRSLWPARKTKIRHVTNDPSRVMGELAFRALTDEVSGLGDADYSRLIEIVNEVADELNRPRPKVEKLTIAPAGLQPIPALSPDAAGGGQGGGRTSIYVENFVMSDHNTLKDSKAVIRSTVKDSAKIVRDDHSTKGGSEPMGAFVWLRDIVFGPIIAGLIVIVIVAIAIVKWPWIKDFLS